MSSKTSELEEFRDQELPIWMSHQTALERFGLKEFLVYS